MEEERMDLVEGRDNRWKEGAGGGGFRSRAENRDCNLTSVSCEVLISINFRYIYPTMSLNLAGQGE